MKKEMSSSVQLRLESVHRNTLRMVAINRQEELLKEGHENNSEAVDILYNN
jgi:hypothetical protein